MATMGRGLPLSKVRLTDNFHVLKHNEEICSAAEAPLGVSSSCYSIGPAESKRVNRPSSPFLKQPPHLVKILTQKGNV